MKKEAATANVTTLTVRPGRLVDKIDLPAEVEPWEEVWVRAEVSGQVINVIAQEGQRITAGQVIVQLDDRDYRSRMERIKANLQLAKTNHARIAELAKRHIVPLSQLDEVEARLKEMETQAQETEMALKRTCAAAQCDCSRKQERFRRFDSHGRRPL